MSPSVECTATYTYPVSPRAFHWEGERLTVAQILAEWRTPAGKHFRVQTGDGRIFLLTYGEINDKWSIAAD